MPDASPVVVVEGEGEGEGADGDPRPVGPGDRLALPVASRDDLGVAGAELHYAIVRAGAGPEVEPESGSIPLALDGLGTPEATGVAALDLAPLGLGDGDAVAVRVRVVDTLPPPNGPNEGWSGVVPLAVAADVTKSAAERLEKALAPAREELESIARLAAENARLADPLRYAAEAARRGNGRWDEAKAADLDRLEEAARAVVDRLQLLARDLESDPALAPLGGPVREAAEAEAATGRASLEDARRADADAPATRPSPGPTPRSTGRPATSTP